MNRWIQVVVFLGVFFSIFGIMNIFVFWHLTSGIWFPILSLFGTVSYVFASYAVVRFKNVLTQTYYVVSALWIGVLFLLFIGFALAEVFPYFMPYVFPIVLILVIYAVFHAQQVYICKVAIPSLPYTIVHLSDLHIGHYSKAKFLKKVVDKVNQLHPDIICITGDIVEGVITEQEVHMLNSFKAPVFAISGNHEAYVPGSDVSLKDLKFTFLVNRAVTHKSLQIIGIDDSNDKEQVKKILSKIKVKKGKSLLLYHRPDDFEFAAKKGILLMLSGHTHGGQIVPFNFLVKLVYSRMNGLYKQLNSFLHVSSGTGTWGPMMRLGTDNVITLLSPEQKIT